jgi:hypothetical protein
MTKVEPPIPMKNLKIASPEAVLTKPVRAVGIALRNRMMPIGNRGPNLSTNGPRRKRIKIVPVTEQMVAVQSCSVVRSNVVWISCWSGEMANLSDKEANEV